MKRKTSFTLVDRAAMAFLYRVSLWMYGGSSVPVLEEGFRTMGTRGYFRYLGVAFKIMTGLQERFGERDAQFLIGFSALWLGCAFCGFNHVMGGTLIHYRDHNALHPIDPHVMDELFEMRDREAIEHIQRLLRDDEFAQLREMAVRMYDIYRREREVETDDDRLLESCLWVWRWTTECSIVEGIDIRPEDAWPVHEVGRDKQLIARFREARGPVARAE